MHYPKLNQTLKKMFNICYHSLSLMSGEMMKALIHSLMHVVAMVALYSVKDWERG